MKKKVLIISHNPINTTDNMGKTIGNIFSKFKEEELCQLYFRNQNVEAANCKDFFCIDDVSMVKSVINRLYETGRIVQNNTIITEEKQEEVFQYGRKRTGMIYILRNMLWKIGKWKSRKLKNWLSKMKPSCIFFVAGDYIFAFNIAMKISKKLNIPLYIYFTDEFYRKNLGENNVSNMLAKNRYRRVFKKAIKQCKTYFTITKDMLDLYENEFGKNGNVLMNSTEIKDMKPIKIDGCVETQIKYIGNLGYGRWENIIQINEVINKVNKISNIHFNFEIYSGEKNQEILNKVKQSLGKNYKGTVSKDEAIEKMKEAHILVHTESFENINKDRVQYSLSTKIPDSLASQRLLLAYGPKDIASIKYIKENKVGLVASNQEELEELLIKIDKEKITVDDMLESALELVEKNHRINNIHNTLYKNIMGE